MDTTDEVKVEEGTEEAAPVATPEEGSDEVAA